MTITDHLFQQVPLIINHDWAKTIDKANKLIALKDRVPGEKADGSDHYSLKSIGNISLHRDSPAWYRLSGPAIFSTMPWLSTLLDALKELGPDNGDISLLNGNAAGHYDNEHQKSALNYIFQSSDTDANTWFEDDYQTVCHSSTANTAWIIDAQRKHGVTNCGTRYSLSIHFEVSYIELREWFNSQPAKNLIFGELHVV
jgi:hypothetical protein